MKELKNQIIATVGLIITAAGGIFIANMEAIFSPEDDSPPPTMEQTITIPPSVVKDTLVITKTVIQKPKKEEREIDW
jgi:hypothetical protein|tara:strand:- start:3565 stop:3795 length:231 start_codon:yes stop_codon:yes gene_type:complete